MDKIEAITSIGGFARLCYIGVIPRTEDGIVDTRALDDETRWTAERAVQDILQGSIVEYHDDEYDDDHAGNPYMVISNDIYEPYWHVKECWMGFRKVGERRWRIDFVDYPNVENKGMRDIYDRDGWVDCVPDEEVRSEWLSLAYRITQVQ